MGIKICLFWCMNLKVAQNIEEFSDESMRSNGNKAKWDEHYKSIVSLGPYSSWNFYMRLY